MGMNVRPPESTAALATPMVITAPTPSPVALAPPPRQARAASPPCPCRLRAMPAQPTLSEEHLDRAVNVANGSPELPQEILLDIFAQLEVPDLVRADPSTGDYFVVLIHNPQSQLSFARAGDDKWTWLPPHNNYEDCLFQGRSLYACTSSGEIHAFDLGTPTVEPKIVLGSMKHCVSDRIYITKAPCGELLQIWRSDASPQGDEEHEYDSDLELELSVGSQMSRTSSIKIHKVDLTSKKLVEVSNLSEHVLFIGLNQSHCHLAEDYPQLKASNAYFTDDNYIDITWFKNDRRDIGVLDMANNSKEEIVSPQLWSNSPTPVWLIPNSRRMSLPSHN
ncbi:hypothetical protein PR202_ga22117 [Eleusine coracana subsp. coracana]|uniref:KIB1-4 beta-propeller domain-containing protein n=1 Tax=Eleusine coracana subsp. coracana TaxID=191504 RepID=A0AAV5D2N4_ELECO|nr:hypothetical protein PR202_ga22117 [Eleusine coracana subsp. coracana]